MPKSCPWCKCARVTVDEVMFLGELQLGSAVGRVPGVEMLDGGIAIVASFATQLQKIICNFAVLNNKGVFY